MKKGIILAGGKGTRLYPLTYATNKHLLPVANKPMIYYPLNTLINAGINDILIIIGGPHAGDFIGTLRNGEDFDEVKIHYAYQKEEGGIAQALSLAESFANNENIAVILGDNCTDADIRKDVESFTEGAMVFLKEVPDPQRFGVPIMEGNKITSIEEKPKEPKSNFAVTGLYLYDNTVFDKIRQISPSARGELEITDVNNLYIQEGTLGWSTLDGYWSDSGTFVSLLKTNIYWGEKEGLI